MKGVTALFLGIFGTFAFSWTGLTLIPNFQIGHLDPQSDEEQTDIYPMPKSGMADRGRKIYVANGCVYCHSQQVRADYAASDIERKWGTRRSAPRDYIFERPALLGKMRVGPDLSNIGKRAPSDDQNAPAPSSTGPAPASSPAASPAPNAATSPAPNAPTSPAPNAATSPAPNASASASAIPANSPAPAPTSATVASVPPPSQNPAATAATTADTTTGPGGVPPQYSAAWHHLHLYSPRSVLAGSTSNMPAFKFLYEKRRITGERSADALKLTGSDAAEEGWEIVPSYDAKCLVAYLMSLDQSHELQEAKLGAAPAPAPATSPAASPAGAKEEKK
ncbi:MAG: cytochrome c oxidase cbb3-type subunit [Verrucomicrobiota bacterium]